MKQQNLHTYTQYDKPWGKSGAFRKHTVLYRVTPPELYTTI